jgi:hypothetical protein
MSERPFAFITRRRLLASGLAAVGVAVAGGAWVARQVRDAPPTDGLRVLDAARFRTLTLLAAAHLPHGGAIEAGATDLGLPALFDAFLVEEPEENVRDLKLALTLVELGPVLFDGGTRTFSHLSDDERAAHWASWPVSGLLLRRQASAAFRKFFGLVYFDHPAVWPAIGYEGPSLALLTKAAPSTTTQPGPSAAAPHVEVTP